MKNYVCLVDVQPIHDENLNMIGAFGNLGILLKDI